ncbi:hypothetical protein chiPu_0033007, partial [Chiloscyllium punctatum]|nr:hypothetical protein [Chiloscyllium punctatum]
PPPPRSTSSETGSRGSEPPDPRPGPRPRPPRAHRVSQLFGRWASERRLGGAEGEEGEGVGGDLSVEPTAPGVLKVYGEGLSAGAHYKSVLASSNSSAANVVREVLGRFTGALGGGGRDAPGRYALCDAVGRGGGSRGRWEGLGARRLADHERPLRVRELWRPAEGLSRRFEIRRRSQVEGTDA